MKLSTILPFVLKASSSLAAFPLESRACSSAVNLSGTNPFATRTLYANSHYGDEVRAAAALITNATLKAQALKVADVGTFLWLDTIASISTLESTIKDTPCDQIFGLVLYDLPGRDCARVTHGQLPAGDLSTYKTSYIDAIGQVLKKYPNTAIAVVVEPGAVASLVINSSVGACANSGSDFREGITYALKTLNLPNVATYVDAASGGVLGWDANLLPTASLLTSLYKNAGSPVSVRGVATNVAGYNAWIKVPGEFENGTDTQYNKAQDEQRYAKYLGAALTAAGFPAHAIVDTSRNGRTGIRSSWSDWCNINGAGFGIRPTSNTSDAIADALVWVKPGGESDGSSTSTEVGYEPGCALADAFKPAPPAPQWIQPYFEMLVANAVPQF
ncbi:glycoside hydrolase family 6 protein [Flagelloscypha sp. PMI_526]|nr:glycoside hydrolase family 6 protein [Flagelloscypha sp. PMI_526]